mmetsp:Transcript_19587/g.45604  ORF Transcript_19587/g.45604 Transcript_19587/m.45604 type:complete len:747 (-) Transcript_19587:236-2476(-)|eukprot:CAMPEP_0116836182 /NCGR_PEP_ID=MMETSP0418-20121206/7952_1 /TAXON_ID=1158023 /ORGANISM="Astrosyne radiata, Strain 13vi08-1A" /LENGTH=746 /DNA_ID=CAMNT_0004465919 /DNA_START=350 /DNA_END=2590 /DNA_ORIENTATION=+
MRVLLAFALALLGLSTSVESRIRGTSGSNGRRRLAYSTEVGLVGGITPSSAVVQFRTNEPAGVQIEYARSASGLQLMMMMYGSSYAITSTTSTSAADDNTGNIELTGLLANTEYHYRLMVDGVSESEIKTFKTFPNSGTAGCDGLRLSVFSDAAPWWRNSSAPAYMKGNRVNDGAHIAFQIGDFDHSDPMDGDSWRLMTRYLRDPHSLAGEDFADKIATQMGVEHIYDDHDYCGNDSDGDCPHKTEVLKGFKEYFPTYPLPHPNDGVFRCFEVCNAKIFILDLRYNRTPNYLPDTATKTMMGTVQKAWLKSELESSTADWNIIISTVSSNYAARPNNFDHWSSSFKNEAFEMRDFLIEKGLEKKTVLVAGDLHTGGAIDNGCASSWGIPEMSVPHTNLMTGNDGPVGNWSQGVTFGSRGPTTGAGFSTLILQGSGKLRMQAKGDDGTIRHALLLPDDEMGVCDGDPESYGLQTCSLNIAHFEIPGKPKQQDEWVCADIVQGSTYAANTLVDEDGNPLPNDHKWYECPASGLRILRTNNIPGHEITIMNPHKPCVKDIHAEMPLNPTPMANGFQYETDNVLGFTMDGVVAFHGLETQGGNAVEPGTTGVQDAGEWYGHPTARFTWHYHSPSMATENDSGDYATTTITSTDLLGYAMDGFPIYGPLANPDSVLDGCNFDIVNNRYHVRMKDQVDGTLPFCRDENDPAGLESTNWNYIIGCFRGDLTDSRIFDSTEKTLPGDCYEVTYT